VKEMLSIGIQRTFCFAAAIIHFLSDFEEKKSRFSVTWWNPASSPWKRGHHFTPCPRNEQRRLDAQILRLLKLKTMRRTWSRGSTLVHRMQHPAGEARIAVVGKYVQLEDAYKSLREALLHGGTGS